MRHMKVLLSIAAALYAAIASAADPSAERELHQAARLHKQGETAAAVAIWKKWAEQGDADAAYNLGLIYQHADGVPYDPEEALRWYRVAAEHDDKPAQFRIGLMYQNGEGVPADAAKAHEWFTKHRQEHWHHHHHPQFQQWQQRAAALLEERDRREAAQMAKRDGAEILAELQRRAGMAQTTLALAKREASAR